LGYKLILLNSSKKFELRPALGANKNSSNLRGFFVLIWMTGVGRSNWKEKGIDDKIKV